MNITIYIDDDGKVTITDLPTDLLPMAMELNGKCICEEPIKNK